MGSWPHVHHVQIYYEDTDFSGVVYYANYLKYFERAREHLLGVEELVKLFREQGIGFVVYRIRDLNFHDGAEFGETLEIRTTPKLESEYRVSFKQEAWRPGARKAAVEGIVELACVGPGKKLVALPKVVRDAYAA